MSDQPNPPDDTGQPRRRRIVAQTQLNTGEFPMTRGNDGVNKFIPPTRPQMRMPPRPGEPPAPTPNAPQNNPRENPQAASVEDVVGALRRAGQKAAIIRDNAESARSGQVLQQAQTEQERIELPEQIAPPQRQNNLRVLEPIDPNDPFASRESLPSNGVFYHIDDLTIAPLSVPAYAMLYKARRENNESGLIDVLCSACNVDLRELSLRDFRYLMYKIRILSSLKAPYNLTYTSLYGNRNSFSINDTMAVKLLEVDPEEYTRAQARGLVIPSLRDFEEFNSQRERLGDEGDFYWPRAQYCQGDSVEEKIHTLKTRSRQLGIRPADFLVEIDEFAAKFDDYGVIESVELADKLFEPQKAIEYFTNLLSDLDSILLSGAIDAGRFEQLTERRDSLRTELQRIQTELSNTGEAAPMRETILFSIEIADFFPIVQSRRYSESAV